MKTRLLALCLALVMTVSLVGCQKEKKAASATTPAQGGVTQTTPGDTNPGSTNPGDTNPGVTNPGTTTPGATNPGETNPGATNPGTTNPSTTTPQVTIPVNTDPIVPQDRIDGSYEQWLAAASVQVTTMMMYPDCRVQGVYALSNTDFKKKMDSEGVVIHIVDAGEDIWILSVPLQAERSTPGTNDLKASAIGYNTYDPVDPATLPELTELSLDSLQPYIQQTLLPAIYMR